MPVRFTARSILATLAAALAAGCARPPAPAPGPDPGSEGPPPAAAPVPEAGTRPPAEAAAGRDSGADPSPLAASEDRALALHRSLLVVDAHNDVTLRLADEPGFDLGARHADGHTDIPRMREGGLDAEFFAVWVKPSLYRGEAAWRRALAMLDAIDRTVARHPAELRLARTAAEIRAAEADGRIAILIGVEGAHALGDLGDEAVVMERLETLHRRGARYMTLTWTSRNRLAGAAGDRGPGSGLTELGRRVVGRMNELGMMVDVSHVSDQALLDAVATSRTPVIASHSAMRALASHPRNVTDEMLRAVAARGGAVCVNFYSGFLDEGWMAARRRARAVGREAEAPPPPLSVLADHVEHAIRVAGPDHVCLGSDFDGVGSLPAGLEDVSRLPALTAELLRRGHDEETLRKVLGDNVLRVMEAAETAAARGG